MIERRGLIGELLTHLHNVTSSHSPFFLKKKNQTTKIYTIIKYFILDKINLVWIHEYINLYLEHIMYLIMIYCEVTKILELIVLKKIYLDYWIYASNIERGGGSLVLPAYQAIINGISLKHPWINQTDEWWYSFTSCLHYYDSMFKKVPKWPKLCFTSHFSLLFLYIYIHQPFGRYGHLAS
jgi:hypothetical protein